MDLAYEELASFAAVPPALEQEEKRIGDSPTQMRRNSAVLFINQNYSHPVVPVILYSISNSLNLINRVSAESEQENLTQRPSGLAVTNSTIRKRRIADRQNILRKGKADLQQELTELTDVSVNSRLNPPLS